MSDPIGGAVQAAELLGRAAYFIWQETRTTLQVNISNRHPRLKLQNFARYCHAGQCSEPQAFSILPEQSRTFRFIAHALGTHIDGCCVYSITAFNRPPATTHNIYLLLAWNIQLGGACKVMLNLVETYPGQDISTSLLKEHYLKDVVPQFQPSGTMMIRTWNLGDDDTKFTVNVSLTDVANGIMEVEIIPANKDAIMNRPFFLTTNYFENVTWDTAGNESEKTKTDDDKFGLTSSMNVFIHNDCENLTLTNCSSIVRNGKLKTRGHNFIGYRAQSKYIFKNKTPFGRTSGTVVYELQHSEQNAPPLLWGYRIFLAMDFLVTAHDHTLRKVCSTLLAVKNANFPEYTDALLHAHEKILGHHMFMRGRPSQWHLHNFDLKISVRFKRLSHAEFYIRLEKAFTKNFNGVPLFLPTGENSDISQDARNTINRYIKSNKQGHGILALEIERDLKIEVEPLMPEHANENAISIECNCSGGVLSSSGKCIFHEKVSESSWSFMHLFAITPTLSVAKSPYLCLLRVKRTYDSFITAVVFTFRGNSSNEELEKTLDYFFAYSGIVGKQENTTENSYDHGRLMERRINLRPDVNFQLITYLSSEPNRLFKIMLKKEFDPAVFYEEARIPATLPSTAQPYKVTVVLNNQHSSISLKLNDFFSTGIPDDIRKGEELKQGERKFIRFTLFYEDRRHGMFLSYLLPGVTPIQMNVHTRLATGDVTPKQTTIIKYKTEDDKTIKIAAKNSFELSNQLNDWDDEPQTVLEVKSRCMDTEYAKHHIAIGHAMPRDSPRAFYVALCIADEQQMSEDTCMAELDSVANSN